MLVDKIHNLRTVVGAFRTVIFGTLRTYNDLKEAINYTSNYKRDNTNLLEILVRHTFSEWECNILIFFHNSCTMYVDSVLFLNWLTLMKCNTNAYSILFCEICTV